MKNQMDGIINGLGELIAELTTMLNPKIVSYGQKLTVLRMQLVKKELTTLIIKMVNGHVTLYLNPVDAATIASEMVEQKYGVKFNLEDVLDIWVTEHARMLGALNH